MAQVKRGVWPMSSFSVGLIHYVAQCIGPGAASAPTIQLTSVLPAADNNFASATYTSTGLYVVTLKELPGLPLDIFATLHRVAGTTLIAAVRTWDAALKTVTIDVRDGASSLAVAQATTDDTITIHVFARNSRA